MLDDHQGQGRKQPSAWGPAVRTASREASIADSTAMDDPNPVKSVSEAPQRAASPKQGTRVARLARILLLDMARAASVFVLLQLFVFQFSVVRGTSMRPNIQDGDRLLVDRLSYAVTEVDRFDVVILQSPHDDDVDYVKRIIGLPGDRIDIEAGRLFVNGKCVREPFESFVDRDDHRRYIVPPGSYFVMGDNRPVSSDSREGWYVAHDRIRGRVRACIWPPSHLRSF